MQTKQLKKLQARFDNLKERTQRLRETSAVLREEKRSLERALMETRTLLEELPGGVVLVQNEKIVMTNKMVQEKMGYSEEELLNRRFLDFVHPKAFEQIRSMHKKRLSGKHVPDQYEALIKTKHGEKIHCEVHVKKIKIKGRIAFLLSLFSVEHRIRQEENRCQAAKKEALARMASGLSRSLSDFLKPFGDVDVHENRISGSMHPSGGEVKAKMQTAWEKGYEVAGKMTLLADDYQDNPRAVPMDLKKILQEAVDQVQFQGRQNATSPDGGIQINTYLRTLSPIEGRPQEIQNAFVHIIKNAMDALTEGGEIFLTTEEDASFTYTYVQDNGAGINEALKDKIFDPFFTTKSSINLGLGLSLAQAAIARHGGEIEVISQEGQGATFIIKLPLAKNKTKKKKSGIKIKNSNFLIIADESMLTDLVSKVLASKGGKVTSVSNSREGLKHLKKDKFDLVLAELNAPSPESSKIITKIKQIGHGIPLILVDTKQNQEGTAHHFEKLGADMVIPSPLDIDRTLKLVSATLSARKTAQ